MSSRSTTPAPRSAPVLPALLLIAACSDYGLATGPEVPPGFDTSYGDEPTDGAARIQVVPDPFDFGSQATACTEGAFPFWIRNVGDEPLQVLELRLEDADAAVSFEVPVVPLSLEPGEWVEGAARWSPLVDGVPGGSFEVLSDDPQAPLIERPLGGEACGDLDADGLCDDVDPDVDGDGLPNAEDEFPTRIVTDDVLVDFDDLAPGTRVTEQYADLGVHLEGAGAPGEGGDSNVVVLGSEHTTAPLLTPSQLLSTWVNEGFNYGADGSGEPGLSGWLDEAAHVVQLRLYTAGAEYAADAGGEIDQGTLVTYDAQGQELGQQTVTADTNAGVESIVVEVMGGEARSFALYTGDFDAVDDLRVLRLEDPACPE